MAEKQYIERDRIVKFIETGLDDPDKVKAFGHDAVEILAEILLAPAADVVEVVHGEWEFRNDGRYGQTRCYCSACGKHSGIGGIRENQMKPFCPNCGARMDGGNNETD